MTRNASPSPPMRAASPQERSRHPAADQPPNSPPPQSPLRNPRPNDRLPSRWVLWGTLLGGLALVSLIPVPNYVSGKTTITSRPEQRDRLVMPRAGIVEIHVEQNDTVPAGKLLAEITSPDLDRALAEAERGLQQAESAYLRARENLIIAQTRWQASYTETALANNRRQERGADLALIEQGIGLPQSRQLAQEQAGLVQEIQGLESEIVAVQEEMLARAEDVEELERQVQNIDTRLKERQILIDNDVFPVNHDSIANLKYQKLQLEREIRSVGNQRQIQRNRIDQLQSQIQQRQRSIAALGEQAQEVRRQTERELRNETDDYLLTRERSRASRQEVAAAETEMRAQARLVQKWQQELARLEQERETLKLHAKTSGTVTTEDLDLLNGKRLEAGEEILALADLGKLTATVQIRQEDHHLVKIKQPTKFSSDQGGKYRAQVNALPPIIEVETQGAAPMATVEILIDNPDDRLLPGGEGHAHIRTRNLRIYQKVAHELGKIFDIDRLIPW